jgi:hypothetical protein
MRATLLAASACALAAALVIGDGTFVAAAAAALLLCYADAVRLLAASVSRPSAAIGAGAVIGWCIAAGTGRPELVIWPGAGLVLALFVWRILAVETGLARATGSVGEIAGTVVAASIAGLLGSHLLLVRATARYGLRGAIALAALVAANELTRRLLVRRGLAVSGGGGAAVTLGAGLLLGSVGIEPFSLPTSLVLAASVAGLAPVGDQAVELMGSWMPEGSASPSLTALRASAGLLASAPFFYWGFRTLVV